MAQASKRKRRERRLSRQITLLERQSTLAQRIEMLERALAQTRQHGAQGISLLLAILAQKGGDIEVTKGTLDQVAENFATLGWSVTPKQDEPATFIVRLTEGEAA